MDREFWEKYRPQFLNPETINNATTETSQPPLEMPIDTDPYPAVPAELKQLRQWVVWRQESRSGKATKVPYQINGKRAKTNDSSTWADYQSVCQALIANPEKNEGIGYVFAPDDPLCGVDLDDCLVNRKLKPWAILIVKKLKQVSYGEISPSGNGIKFWTRGSLPTGIKHKIYLTEDGAVVPQGAVHAGAIEAYDKTRFFTITGVGKYNITDGQAIVDWLCQTYLKPQSETRQTHTQKQHSDLGNLSVNEVLEKIRQSKQAHKFQALMNGDTTGYGSNSEADLALCGILIFWTQDSAIIDAIFRQSALMREKWDEKHRADGATYGEMTLQAALANQTLTYPTRHRRDPIMSIAYRAVYSRRF